MTDDLHRELESLAFSEATSGRARLAKVTALHTLERLRRSTAEGDPVDDDGRFHPGGPEGGTWTAAIPTGSARPGGSGCPAESRPFCFHAKAETQ